MKKTIKTLLLCFLAVFGVTSIAQAQVKSSTNTVPDNYYANYKFINDWNQIWDIFNAMKSRNSLGMSIDSSYFSDLYTHFSRSFPHLTKDYSATYEKCLLLASSRDVDALLGTSCYKSLTAAVQKINSSYTVKAAATANPIRGAAPLTVTFDARGSVDPSSETIPTANFFWYYRDEKGVDRPMGNGNVINYEFKEAGNFVVHLVVRSSNVDMGILDGEKDITINVAPKAANIVVYANTRRMSTSVQTKIGITEGEKGIVFDGSATMPTEGRKILSHKWTLQNTALGFLYTKSGEGAPGHINIPLKGNGEFKVTLETRDNENNRVSETFVLFMSDPVTIIKQTPERGTTSTTMTFDGSASYSITNRLNTYLREIFDSEGNKVVTEQGKKMSKIFTKPGNYRVRLTVTDMAGQQNIEYKDLYMESTIPTPQFTVTPTSKRTYPSEFTLDASYSSDIDVLNGVDSLEYSRKFSTDKVSIISTENNNEKVVVQFDEVGKHTIKLTVTDEYGKIATISKTIEVKSILRPEIEPIPGAITRGKEMKFKSSINTGVRIVNYVWNYGDGSNTTSDQAVNTMHVYGQKGVYSVALTVYDEKGNSNTVTERVFIGEIDYPIAAFRVKDSKGYYIQASETCVEVDDKGNKVTHYAYPVDRYAKFTINSSISVNTQGNSQRLQSIFQPEALYGPSQATSHRRELNHNFSTVGCHYVDLTVKDQNVGKQDKVRIWFKVKNALPTIRNVTLSFPQYSDESVIGFSQTNNSNTSQFDCSGSSNLTIKVTAVSAADSDGSISRLRFYYYNVDDPDRILEYKETWITTPYAYFVIPKIGGEYKFGVMVYDNDGGMINSDDVLSSNPSVYFPGSCDVDVPMITLVLSSQNIQVGDTVTYTVTAKIGGNYDDFETDRTFYYDFTGDGTRDLVTKKSSATYTFMEAYEEGVIPRVAVEYRGKIGKGDGATIFVKNGIKPILLYDSYKNNVIFRDLSVGTIQQRQICFDTNQCEMGNTKYRRTHIVTTGIDSLTGGTSTIITQTDSFLQKYPDYGTYNVSIYLKSKFGIEVQTGFQVRTTSNENNGKVAPGINVISIPKMTQTNANMEVFLSKIMNSTLLMYISNETGEACYVDTDIATDSDGDGKTDNDMDVACNTLAKIVYEPSYESAIGRIYFTNEGNLVYKNFYVTFEGYILELDEEKLSLYNDITILVNGLADVSTENADLKLSLDVLRKNLNNKNLVSATVVTIQTQLDNGGVVMDQKQLDLLNSIIDRLSNADTVVAVGMNEYEKNKLEIMALLPNGESSIKTNAQARFSEFEKSLDSGSGPEEKSRILNSIRDNIIKDLNKNKRGGNETDFNRFFCNIFEYYDIVSTKCGSDENINIARNYEGSTTTGSSSTSSGLPGRLKVILIILVGGLLVMGGVIIFFSIKARLNSASEEDDEG